MAQGAGLSMSLLIVCFQLEGWKLLAESLGTFSSRERGSMADRIPYDLYHRLDTAPNVLKRG